MKQQEHEENLPESIRQGSFKFFGVEIKCHVLDDGRAIIEAESIDNLIEAIGTPTRREDFEQVMEELKKVSEWMSFAEGAHESHH